jgi:hypothetical protein
MRHTLELSTSSVSVGERVRAHITYSTETGASMRSGFGDDDRYGLHVVSDSGEVVYDSLGAEAYGDSPGTLALVWGLGSHESTSATLTFSLREPGGYSVTAYSASEGAETPPLLLSVK